MFTGHFAVGFAAKKAAPKTALPALLAAALFLDILWPPLVLIGIEHVRIAPGFTAVSPLDLYDYPYSHSLVGALVWSAAFGLVYFIMRRYSRGAWVLGLTVFSHWVLDFISHSPDMPLAPGIEGKYGLGLWNSVAGTAAVEMSLFLVGVALYFSATTALDRKGKFGLWAMAGLLFVLQLASYSGSPPPSVSAMAWVGILMTVIFVIWAWWVDKHRESRE